MTGIFAVDRLERKQGCALYFWIRERDKDDWNKAFSTADILTCHSKKRTGVTDYNNDGSVLFTCPCKL